MCNACDGTVHWLAVVTRISTGEEDPSPESLARISELEQALATNPYNYANHEELVKLLKGGEDFDRLEGLKYAFLLTQSDQIANSTRELEQSVSPHWTTLARLGFG